jgi:hypothetical protein
VVRPQDNTTAPTTAPDHSAISSESKVQNPENSDIHHPSINDRASTRRKVGSGWNSDMGLKKERF